MSETNGKAKAAPRGRLSTDHQKVAEILVVPVTHIRPDPKQPREYFDPEDLRTKAESMRADGQDKPIDVIAVTGDPEHSYQIVDGEQRWRALQLAEMPSAEVRILPAMNAQQIYRRQTRANHVSPLTVIELAKSFKRGVEEFGMTQAQLGRDHKCSPGKVAQYLALMKLHPTILRRLDPSIPEDAQLPLMIAVALSQVEDQNQQLIFFARITKGDTIAMTTDEVRSMVANYLDRSGGKRRVGRPLEQPKDLRFHLVGLADKRPRQLAITDKAMAMKQEDFDRLFRDMTAFDVERIITGFDSAAELLEGMVRGLVHTFEKKKGNVAKLVEKCSTVKRIRSKKGS